MQLTHVALQVRDLERSIAFYERVCGLRVVHDRTEDFRVVWVGTGEQPPRFVIVLLAKEYELNVAPPLQHVGLSVASRQDVDTFCARAERHGAPIVWHATEGGPVVGYFAAASDPDGNLIEVSHGQRIG